ncbi:MAG TPA: hypothetical protein VEI25_21255 [Paraburkholderia sp.]|nr:hypothetical protein [Paraburkholderia sp.]
MLHFLAEGIAEIALGFSNMNFSSQFDKKTSKTNKSTPPHDTR